MSLQVAPLAYLRVQRNVEGLQTVEVAVPPLQPAVPVYTALAALPLVPLILPMVVWSSSMHWLRESSHVVPDFVGFDETPPHPFPELLIVVFVYVRISH